MNQEEISKILNDNTLSPDEKVKKMNSLMILNDNSLSAEEKIAKMNDLMSNEPESQQVASTVNVKELVNSEMWPEAVLEFQIADEDSEEDKSDRAEGIVDILIEEDLEGKKFLDFGCGEGHAPKYASEEASLSVGYDLVQTGKLNWESSDEYFLTTDFDKVQEKGPFDVVLIYDVLDHAEDPVDALNKVASVLKEGGKVYLRCHPWCGRHGSHLYRKINKAFVHLVLNEEELKELGCELEYNKEIIYPLRDYGNIIDNSNLKSIKNEIEEQSVEEFFKENDFVRNRLLAVWDKDNWEESCPEFQMKQCFLDYVLEKK